MQCVYLLAEIDFDGTRTGLYKIGQTKRGVESRKRQYQAGNARRVDTLHTIQVFDAQAVETALHRHWARERINQGGGDEWFDFRRIGISSVINSMNYYDQTHVYTPRPSYSPAQAVSYRNTYDEGGIPVPLVIIGAVILFFMAIASNSQNHAPATPRDPGAHSLLRSSGVAAQIEIPASEGNALVNLRSDPDGSSRIEDRLRDGERLTAYEFSQDQQWRRVKLSNGTSGWVSSKFVK